MPAWSAPPSARQLARYRLRTVLLERANDVGTGTSKANTAIVHTGFDTQPGSLESSLVRRGHELLTCVRAGERVSRSRRRAPSWWPGTPSRRRDSTTCWPRPGPTGTNGPPGWTSTSSTRREPHLAPGATGAVTIPDESIICPWSPSIAFATEAVGAGVELRLGVDVTDGRALR